MYAIILTGGKQVKAEVGQVIYTEKIDGEKDGKVCFDKVLYVEGDKTLVGQPFVAGAKVNATIVKQGKEKKIVIFKYKQKKGSTRRKQGHRQPYTKLTVESIAA